MNCADFASRLNDEFDGSDTPPTADLVDHAAQCASCRATWEGFRLLSDCIGAWRQETPEVDLAPAVVFALNQSAPRSPEQPEIAPRQSSVSRPRSRYTSRARAQAVAAALLIAALLFPVLRRSAILTPPVAQTTAFPGDSVPVDVVVQHDQGTRQLATQLDPDHVPYYDLAQRAAGALGQMTMLVLRDEAAPPFHHEEPPADGQAAGWMDDVGRELKPVGRSLGNAFDFLWRAGESADG